MPNRIIKETICTSDTIDQLSWFEEVVFYRLTVNCDDYGRFDGRPSIVRSRLFPLKHNVTEKSVADAMNTLSTVGLVIPYECDGKPILQLATWDRHQSVRNKRSKYPGVDGSDVLSASENVKLLQVESNCKQLKSIASKCSRNPIQSESESVSESNPTPLPPKGGGDGDTPPPEKPPRATQDVRFDEFWTAYPRKVGKLDARRAWGKIKPDKPLFDRILKAVGAARASPAWQRENGQYIPNPATWLRGGRWDDEPTPPDSGGRDKDYESGWYEQ